MDLGFTAHLTEAAIEQAGLTLQEAYDQWRDRANLREGFIADVIAAGDREGCPVGSILVMGRAAGELYAFWPDSKDPAPERLDLAYRQLKAEGRL